MLMCDETVTLIRHVREADGDRYIPIVLNGVSWFGKVRISPTESGAASVTEVTVRIPKGVLSGGTEPHVGDYIKRGTIQAGELDRDQLSGMDGLFEVLDVGDNRRGSLPHWRVSGA